jgi:hypothetical protein
MSKFIIFILGTIFGLILGGALIFYFFGGVPRAAKAPGTPIQPPDAAGMPAGTATVTLNQDFFNTVLASIFRDMNAPAFPLGLNGETAPNPQTSDGCDGNVILLSEGSSVKTGVSFENNQITLPLAFRGSRNVLGFGCLQFTGWAQANLKLNTDENKNVFGEINIQTINVDGIPPFASGFITPVIQTTLNNRVNPVTILKSEQIALKIPVAATKGTLQANVTDVRAEVKNNALNLYVTYDFKGTK